MMESSNLHQGLISPPAPSSPSRTAASASDDKTGMGVAENRTRSAYSPPPPPVDNAKVAKNPAASFSPPPAAGDGVERSSETDQTSPPLPPSSLSLPADGTGSSDSPSPPAVEDANSVKNLAASLPSPPAVSDVDEGSSDRTRPIFADPSISPSRAAVLGSNGSSSPPPRRWWPLRRPQPRLPIYAPAPPPGRSFNWFHQWKETNRPKAPRLDSTGVEKLIGVFGFSLFGSISLLPSTMDLVKELSNPWKTSIMISFGIIWAVASVGVLCGLHGKTDFEQAVCRHTGRLGMLGLASLVMLHVRWALPDGGGYDAVFYVLLLVAALLHFGSWAASCIVGEDRMDDVAPADASQ